MSLIQQSEYSSSFSAKVYLQMYYSKIEQDWISNFRKRIFNEFFQKYSCKWEKGSARLLDFSAGAVICNYISAAPHVAEIVHSAYTDDERREIELWMRNGEGAHDWNAYIKYAVNSIEGLEGDTAWKERVELLRMKMKVVSCNIYDDLPVSLTEDESRFSIICTSLALEAACKTIEDFKTGIKKLVNLLRVGGYIAILLVEDETYYVVGSNKWAVLPVSLTQLEEAVKEAGCIVLMSERDPSPIRDIENPTLSDERACVFLAAYKIN